MNGDNMFVHHKIPESGVMMETPDQKVEAAPGSHWWYLISQIPAEDLWDDAEKWARVRSRMKRVKRVPEWLRRIEDE